MSSFNTNERNETVKDRRERLLESLQDPAVLICETHEQLDAWDPPPAPEPEPVQEQEPVMAVPAPETAPMPVTTEALRPESPARALAIAVLAIAAGVALCWLMVLGVLRLWVAVDTSRPNLASVEIGQVTTVPRSRWAQPIDSFDRCNFTAGAQIRALAVEDDLITVEYLSVGGSADDPFKRNECPVGTKAFYGMDSFKWARELELDKAKWQAKKQRLIERTATK